MIKFACCLAVVGGSLRAPWLSPLELIAIVVERGVPDVQCLSPMRVQSLAIQASIFFIFYLFL